MPVDFGALDYDDWYAWTILPFDNAAWAQVAPSVAYLDGAPFRAALSGGALVAAYRGGDGGGDVNLLTDSGTAVTVPGAVLSAAEHLPSHRSLSATGQRLEVTPHTVGGVTTYLVRGGDAVVGYLSAAAASASADALT